MDMGLRVKTTRDIRSCLALSLCPDLGHFRRIHIRLGDARTDTVQNRQEHFWVLDGKSTPELVPSHLDHKAFSMPAPGPYDRRASAPVSGPDDTAKGDAVGFDADAFNNVAGGADVEQGGYVDLECA
jgi:hypothetical protein